MNARPVVRALITLGFTSCLATAAIVVADPVPTGEAAASVKVDVHVGEALPEGTTEAPRDANRNSLEYRYGTQVSFAVTGPQGDLVGIDGSRCELQSVLDDKGTDLMRVLEKGTKRPWPCLGGGQLRYSSDGRTVDADFWFPTVPAADARRVTVAARVVVLYGSGRVTSDSIPLDLANEKETPASVGNVRMKLNVSKRMTGEWMVWLSSASLEMLRDMQLTDGDGTSVSATRNGKGGVTNEKGTVDESYGWELKGPLPKALRATITCYEKIEPVTVPVRGAVPLKQFPTGPLSSTIDGGAVGLRLEIKYDRVALKDAGMSPQDVDRQIRHYLDVAEVITLQELDLLPILKPDGSKTVLLELIDSVQLKLQRRLPAG